MRYMLVMHDFVSSTLPVMLRIEMKISIDPYRMRVTDPSMISGQEGRKSISIPPIDKGTGLRGRKRMPSGTIR